MDLNNRQIVNKSRFSTEIDTKILNEDYNRSY